MADLVPTPPIPTPTPTPTGGPSASGGGGVFDSTVRRPIALLVIFATLVVVGGIAYRNIPIQLFPADWTSPSLQIYIPTPDGDPRENEEKVARLIEEQLRTLSGIDEFQSWSSANSVELVVEFDSDLDMDLAKAEVRDRIERARPQFPDYVDRVWVWSEDSSSIPIAFFGILHPGDSGRTDYLMDEVVVPQLERVQGVSKVDVWGVLQDSVRILLDEDKVIAQRLDIGALIRRLMTDNFAQPLGEIDDGGRELILRSDMRFTTLEEIEDYPLGNGLRIRDVGEVRRTKSVRNMLSRIDGSYSYFGVAMKDSESNVVDTCRNLRRVVDELADDPRLAGEFEILMFFNQGSIIESSLAQLRSTAMWGGVLALVVLLVFVRRVRLTLCVALSIPVSILMAIAFEHFTGGSFNLLTMLGITLGMGMLVDNSVVVIENIVRMRSGGASPLKAAAEGTHQIALAVTLATLTTVVVFLPLIFMGNQSVRVFFGGIGIPLCVSLIFSLLVAVVFLPVFSARLLGKDEVAEPKPSAWRTLLARIVRIPVRGCTWLVGGLRAGWFVVLRLVYRLDRIAVRGLAPLRWLVVAGAIALAWFSWRATTPAIDLADRLRPFGSSPGSVPEGAGQMAAVNVTVTATVVALLAILGLPRWRRRSAVPPRRPVSFVPAGDSLLDMVIAGNRRLVTWTLDHRIFASFLAFLAFMSIVIPVSRGGVAAFGEGESGDSLSFNVRFDADFTLREAEREVAVYEAFLEEHKQELGFEHWSNRFSDRWASLAMYWDRPIPREEAEEMESFLKEHLPRIPGHRLRFYDEERASERSLSVARYRLTGPDSTVLARLGEEAKELLSEVPGLKGVATPSDNGPEQVSVDIDRDMAHDLGLDSETVQQNISYVLHGFQLPRYQEDGRDVPFLIEYDEAKVSGLSSLRDLGIWSGSGVVPLSSIADLTFEKGSRRIHRLNGRTGYTLTAEVEDPLRLIEITEAGHRALGQLALPRGYEVDRSDSALSRQEAEFDELFRALALSIVLVFLVMGILFESVLLPFSVLLTIPFAILGAMWTLFLTGTPLDFVGWIGLIILAGVVVNNGIVLIDRIHRLVAEGMDRHTAVITGCAHRVRPILMTALTTVFGLIPMIVARPATDSIDYRALATLVAGGLATSTFFTLWVVPLAYTVFDDLSKILSSRLRWWLRRPVRRSTPPETFDTPVGAGGLQDRV